MVYTPNRGRPSAGSKSNVCRVPNFRTVQDPAPTKLSLAAHLPGTYIVGALMNHYALLIHVQCPSQLLYLRTLHVSAHPKGWLDTNSVRALPSPHTVPTCRAAASCKDSTQQGKPAMQLLSLPGKDRAVGFQACHRAGLGHQHLQHHPTQIPLNPTPRTPPPTPLPPPI
jgi:hypothetical protein